MNKIKIIIINILFYIPFLCYSQSLLHGLHGQDSVWLDSVTIKNEYFIEGVYKYYRKNKKTIDTNKYLFIGISRDYYSAPNDTSVLSARITIKDDIDNNILSAGDIYSLYFFTINNVLCLLEVNKAYKHLLFSKEGEENLLFEKTNAQKMFIYEKRKYIHIPSRPTSPVARYKIKMINDSELQIEQQYYMKYPASKIRQLYYRIRYRKFFTTLLPKWMEGIPFL